MAKQLITELNNQESSLYDNISRKAYLDQSEIIEKAQSIIDINCNGETINICTLGNISVLKGRAKSKKTFAGTLFLAALIKGHVQMKLLSNAVSDRKIVFFDTEQSKYHVSMVQSRIRMLVGNGLLPDIFEVYCLRPFPVNQRREFINQYYNKNDVQFAFIDGARDLLTNINDADQSTSLMDDMMRWTHDCNCHLMTVIHENQSDGKARGHIGSELQNKAETVIGISKDEGTEYSTITASYMRGKEFEDFKFYIDNGLPIIDMEYTPQDKVSTEIPF